MEHIQKDDPRLTAYALGELGAEEAEQVAQAVERDPELAAEVQALRELAGALRQTLRIEPLPAAITPTEGALATIAPTEATDDAAGVSRASSLECPAMPVAGGRRMWWYALSGCAAAAAITFSLIAWRDAQKSPPLQFLTHELAGEPVLQPGTDGGARPNNRVVVEVEDKDRLSFGVGASTQDSASGSVTLDKRNFEQSASAQKAVMDAMKQEMEGMRGQMAKEREAMRAAGGNPEALKSANGKATVKIGGGAHVRYEATNPVPELKDVPSVGRFFKSGDGGSNAQAGAGAPNATGLQSTSQHQQTQEAIAEESKKAEDNWATDIKEARITPRLMKIQPLDESRIKARAYYRTSAENEDSRREQAPQASERMQINAEMGDERVVARVDPALVVTNMKKLPEGEGREVAEQQDSVRQQSAPSNTESYDKIEENEFLRVSEQPLSTFSIDVDTASYSNLRRLITSGQLPPPGAVRIEELVNYFDYDYQPPQDGTPFATHMALAACPWSPEHQLLRVGLKGKVIAEAERPDCNLVFLLDVSGSMSEPNKLPLVREGMKLLVNTLRDTDRVAIAVYAGASGLVLPSTPCAQRQTILNAIDNLSPGGSTNGAAGITLAYATAASSYLPKGVNRVILCTDGDFNVGVTNQSQLTDLIEKKAKEGVFLTVLGFGMGNLKDSTLEKLADKGNGNYGYIDTLSEAKKLLVEQMSGTLMTIAKDVKIQIEFNPQQVQGYRLIGYENRKLNKEDFNDDKKDAGEIGAGHTVTALYELVPAGAVWPAQRPAVDPLKYQAPAASAPDAVKEEAGQRIAAKPAAASTELLTLKLRYKEPDGEVSKLLTFPLAGGAKKWDEADGDLRFAASVAAWGMLLRHSAHAGSANFNTVVAWGESAKGSDPSGYRAEFLKLVRMSASLNNR